MASEKESILEIGYTADSHGCYEELARCVSSFPRNKNSLLIDGGDFLQGSPLTYYFNRVLPDDGESIPAELMNLCGYDIIVPGNHEFSYGIPVLQKFLRHLKANCLCANTTLDGMKKTEIVTLPNGWRIGITGICTPAADPKLFKDAFSAAKEASEELDLWKPDLKICIYHGGFEMPPEKFDPERDILQENADVDALSDRWEENQGLRIAKELDFDILLTAHQHQLIPGREICGTYVCQTGMGCRQLLRLTVHADRRITTEVITPERKPNTDITFCRADALLQKLLPEFEKWLEKPLGELDQALPPEEHIRMAAQGSLIANLINQIEREESGADIACTALGNEISGFRKTVTAGDILQSYIYPNTLKVIRINGKTLRRALERSAEYFTVSSTGALTVSEEFLSPMVQHFNYDYYSGIEYSIWPEREKGNRVGSVRYCGKELQDEDELTLALNDYRAAGLGGYEFLADCPVLWESGKEISEMIIDYFHTRGKITVDAHKYISVEIP